MPLVCTCAYVHRESALYICEACVVKDSTDKIMFVDGVSFVMRGK